MEFGKLEADILIFLRGDVSTATYEVALFFRIDAKQAYKILSKMEKDGYVSRLPWKRDNNIIWSANSSLNNTNQVRQEATG